MQYLSFCNWLISLRIMSSSLPHIVACCRISFFLKARQYSIVCNCQGPAPVDPGNSKVGMASASLEKYIFNYRYKERLETDSVVGRLVEKKRLNNLDYVE